MNSEEFQLKIRIFKDGDEWCALIGENLQSGVAGFDKSPAKALNVLLTYLANLPSIDVLADELRAFLE